MNWKVAKFCGWHWRIQHDFDTTGIVSPPKPWHSKKIKSKKNKSLLEWLAFSDFSSNAEVLNSKISGPSAPTIDG